MNITVKFKRTNENKKIDIKKNSTILDILKIINLKPDTLIVLSDKKPLPEDEILKDKQELEIIQVSSGG